MQAPGSLLNVANSPDNNIKVTINSGLSELGQVQLVSHEGYGHALLYSKCLPHKHNGITVATSSGISFREGNKELSKQIANSIAETTKNYEEKKQKTLVKYF